MYLRELVLPETTREGAVTAAEKFQTAVEHHRFSFDGVVIPVTISLGVAGLRSGTSSPRRHATAIVPSRTARTLPPRSLAVGAGEGWDEPPEEVAMTISQLYALYCAGHAEAWRVCDGGVLRAFEVAVSRGKLTDLERLILELALHDATNGTPARTRQGFDRAVAQGADLLRRLGFRPDTREDGLDEAA